MDPASIQQSLHQATVHHRAGRLGEAEKLYRTVLAAQPGNPVALHLLGTLAGQVGRHDAAAELIRRAIAINPADADAHFNLGVSLAELGRLGEAVVAYRQAAALRPQYLEAHNNLALCLQKTGEIDAAIASFRRALALRPDNGEVLNNLGTALKEKGESKEAIDTYRRAMALRPGDPGVHLNLGLGLKEAGFVEEAIASYRQALRLSPDYVDAHYALAWALLLNGEYPEGWAQYECRWRKQEWIALGRHFSQPRWDGGGLSGRRILLHAEQGFGDTVHFARYIPLVAQRGGRVIVMCQPALKRLLASVASAEQIVAADEALPDFDLHCPLLSLPYVMGTTVGTIPASIPYLHAEPELARRWQAKLNVDPPALKVGLVWAGSPGNPNDANRSLSLRQLAPLAEAPGVRFFSLQKGPAASQTHDPANARFHLVDIDSGLNDFADTAAALANLDLLITVDTSVAHLAGSLGHPAWVLLPHSPDYRWLREREDTSWYPTLRLFRQKKPRQWEEVIGRVAQELRSVAGALARNGGATEG